MSQPEIFRRCTVCGGSFRSGALFCPQCGNPAAPDQRTEQPAPEVNATRRKTDAAVTQPASRLAADSVSLRHDPREGRVKPQVDKLRRASSVVIDEASYDPGVRFILVVAVLFIIFLVLLFLSKWLG
jgi:hypothetical protein